MKKINTYIIEKLKKLNRSSTFKYNPDDLNNDNEVLYTDRGDEDDQDIMWNECKYQLDKINDTYDGFILFKFKPILEMDLVNYGVYNLNTNLEELINIVITGKDAGYEVRLKGGHLEIECLNSGSSSIYYIYALNSENYNLVKDWWMSEDEPEDLNFLRNEGVIEEITLDK